MSRNSGKHVKKTFSFWQAKFKEFSMLMLVPIGGTVVFGIIGYFFDGKEGTASLVAFPVFLVAMVAFWYLMLRTMAGLFLYIRDSENEKDVWQSFVKGNTIVWSVFFVSLLVGIKVFLWTLLLIVPGIIFSVYYSLSSWSLVVEGKKGNEALRRSKELIEGYWWAVVGRNLYVGLIYAGIFIVLSLPLMAMPDNSVVMVVYNLLIQAIQYLVMPVYYIFTFLLFKNLVFIKGSSGSPERLETLD